MRLTPPADNLQILLDSSPGHLPQEGAEAEPVGLAAESEPPSHRFLWRQRPCQEPGVLAPQQNRAFCVLRDHQLGNRPLLSAWKAQQNQGTCERNDGCLATM
jgi:hypothetical protein